MSFHKTQRRQHGGEEHREQHDCYRCFAQIVDLPDVARSVGHLTRLSRQPRDYMREPGAELKENSDQPQFAALLRVVQPLDRAATQIERKSLIEQPRSEKPA